MGLRSIRHRQKIYSFQNGARLKNLGLWKSQSPMRPGFGEETISK